MSKRLRVQCGGVTAEATLFDQGAPRTVEALWNILPLHDRTIQTKWSGNAWRTERNYELLPAGTPVENVAGRLSAGDIIYYYDHPADFMKIGIAYGPAQWLGPFMERVDVALIGKIDRNIDAFVARCDRIIFDGPLAVDITKLDAGT